MCQINIVLFLYIIKLCQKQLSQTKIFSISIFNVAGCLATRLTFRPFFNLLTLDP